MLCEIIVVVLVTFSPTNLAASFLSLTVKTERFMHSIDVSILTLTRITGYAVNYDGLVFYRVIM